MWEWVAERDEHGGSAGISGTCHGAMEVLAKTLIQAGRPRSGRATPVIFINSIHEETHYLRGITQYTAVYDGQVIQWR